MIYIAADHGGYNLKEHLKKFLEKQNLPFKDLGAHSIKPEDDYPDYAEKVARYVSKKPLSNIGILLCRSGQGVAITANKFKNVRAAVVWNTKQAKLSKNDDMSNVLCFPADFLANFQAEKILEAWIDTSYSTEERHIRRVKKISDLENR